MRISAVCVSTGLTTVCGQRVHMHVCLQCISRILPYSNCYLSFRLCLHDEFQPGLRFNPGLEAGLRKKLKNACNSSTRVEKTRRVLCRILVPKIVRLVGKRFIEFFALDSNPPLVNTRQISTRLSCNVIQ